MSRLNQINEPIYQSVMNRLGKHWSGTRQALLYLVNDKAGDLWCQYRKIVRGNHKKYPDKETFTVFPEIFIEGGKMLQAMFEFQQR